MLLRVDAADRLDVGVLPEPEPVCVFAGTDRPIRVVFRNPTAQTIRMDVVARVYQLTSETAVRWTETPWRRIELFPRQTVVETALFSFPMVNAPTRFAIRWLDNSERLLGITEVLVHPPDLLQELKTLAGQGSLGVFDPDGQLKPWLRRVAVEFLDMEDSGFDAFRGQLAIVGPFESKARMRENLASEIAMLAKRGVAVVWIRPPERSDRLTPSFYSVPTGRGTVLVAQAGLVARLADEPPAQLNLIELARQALHPELPRLPGLAGTPETNTTP